MSVSGLKRYLNGGEPTASKIMQIGDAIGVSPAWLLTGKGPVIDGTPQSESTHEEQSFSVISGSVTHDEMRAVNQEILEKSIEAIDLLCNYKKLKISSKKKAKIIALVYVLSLRGEDVDDSVCYNLLQLAS
ncbi:hypothetical protein VQ7734_04535 [Vibrio quintilis]|uniref:HTH cro/C1-type domain-containing protein n=2 Tax=Vibrio quintilis TaxID=1117707 RepID=A0A1M7Z1L4_9VIBR|nr:hypothetical protein VQ7734_04535 [Vibrio quintilis]